MRPHVKTCPGLLIYSAANLAWFSVLLSRSFRWGKNQVNWDDKSSTGNLALDGLCWIIYWMLHRLPRNSIEVTWFFCYLPDITRKYLFTRNLSIALNAYCCIISKYCINDHNFIRTRHHVSSLLFVTMWKFPESSSLKSPSLMVKFFVKDKIKDFKIYMYVCRCLFKTCTCMLVENV